jgi:hypothetical protein
MNDTTLSIIEVFISLVVESVILGGLFSWISNKAAIKTEQTLRAEMKNVEDQNKLIYQELSQAIFTCRDDVLAQIKESAENGHS